MLVIGKGVEVESQQALAIALAETSTSVGEKVPEKALLMVRMWLAKEAAEWLWGRHLCDRKGVSESDGRRYLKGSRLVYYEAVGAQSRWH